jgi:hypothetical protein
LSAAVTRLRIGSSGSPSAARGSMAHPSTPRSRFGSEIVYHDTQALDAGAEQPLSVSCRTVEQAAEASNILIVALADQPNRSPPQFRAGPPHASRRVRGSISGEARSQTRKRPLARWTPAASAATRLTCSPRKTGCCPAVPHPSRLLRHPQTLFTRHLGSAVDDVRRGMSAGRTAGPAGPAGPRRSASRPRGQPPRARQARAPG